MDASTPLVRDAMRSRIESSMGSDLFGEYRLHKSFAMPNLPPSENHFCKALSAFQGTTLKLNLPFTRGYKPSTQLSDTLSILQFETIATPIISPSISTHHFLMSGALFTPKKIGPIVVPNRFMRSATWEALGDPIGRPTFRQRTIMESLAEGGVGLIVTAAMVVTPKCSLVGKANGMFTGDHSRAWAPIIKNIHSHGSKIAIQLVHGARFSNPAFNGGFPAIPVSSLKEGEPEMTNADIEEFASSFWIVRIFRRARALMVFSFTVRTRQHLWNFCLLTSTEELTNGVEAQKIESVS